MSNIGNISNFINSNSIIPQRNNRFSVDIINPSGEALDSMNCESIELPNNGITSIQYQIDNKPNIMIPYAKNYDTNSFQVTIRESLLNKKATVLPYFEKWLNLIVSKNPVTRKYEISYYNDCLGEAVFTAYDLDFSVSHKIYFYKIYPVSVKPNQYSYDERDTYTKVQVTFVFEEFEIK
jgi:hypothetical protein